MLKRYLLTWPIALLMAAGCQGTVLPAETIVSDLKTANNQLNAIENDLSRNSSNNSEAYLNEKEKGVKDACKDFKKALNSAIVRFRSLQKNNKGQKSKYEASIRQAKNVRKQVNNLKSNISKAKDNRVLYSGFSQSANMRSCISGHRKYYQSDYTALTKAL